MKRTTSELVNNESRRSENSSVPRLSDEQIVTGENSTTWMVSAEGLEPSTHALKGHCSTN